MKLSGRIRSLRVQASQTVDLSFNMPGIIEFQNFDQKARKGPAFLGERVKPFDVKKRLYEKLGETKSSTGAGQARLKYDSVAISEALMAISDSPVLFVLRNVGLAAQLDQLVARREVAVLDRFMHATEIKEAMVKSVPATVVALEDMKRATASRFTEIDKALKDAKRDKVITSSETKTTLPKQKTTTNSFSEPIAMVSSRFESSVPRPGDINTKIFEGEPNGSPEQTQSSDQTGSFPTIRDKGNAWVTPSEKFKTQEAVTDTIPQGDQESTSDLPSFQHPVLENIIATSQQQVAINQELMRNKLLELKIPHMDRIIKGELAAIDQETRTVQINYAHTFLISPIAGLITAVYKDVGESVEPGEPVLRIENDAHIMLVGRVQFKTALRAGQRMTVELIDAFEDASNRQLPLACVVRAVRGHEADDDEWDVVLETKNPIFNGAPLLPINYQVDPDTAKIFV